ncbi:hypothetical protein, partial [Treponema sp. R8-4-B8]
MSAVEALSTITAEDIPYEKPKVRTAVEILSERNAMVGMKDNKKTIRQIANMIQMQKEFAEINGEEYDHSH